MPVIGFFKEARDELARVVWPTREQTTRYTILVALVAIASGIFLGGLDYVLTMLTNFLITR